MQKFKMINLLPATVRIYLINFFHFDLNSKILNDIHQIQHEKK